MAVFTETEEFSVVSPDSQKSVLDRPMTRRQFNKQVAVTAGAAVVGGVIGVNALTGDEKAQNPVHEDNPISQQAQAEEIHASVPEQIEISSKDTLNHILSLQLFTAERNDAEVAFAESAQTLEDIDLGLSVCADLQARIYLLDKRWELRMAGNEGMTHLSEEQLKFCYAYDIKPEILGMCLDAYGDAKSIITQLQGELRDDHAGKSVDPEMLMINPGGMAKLIMTETSGFENIGSELANTQFGENAAVDSSALHELCNLLRRDTGLQFDANNIPGSEFVKMDNNTSGGAIGIQFLPSRALEYYRELAKVGEVGNIFHPIQSIKMAWTFLARQEWLPEENDYRYGYMKGKVKKGEEIELALEKWNDKESQVAAIKSAAVQYSDAGL